MNIYLNIRKKSNKDLILLVKSSMLPIFSLSWLIELNKNKLFCRFFPHAFWFLFKLKKTSLNPEQDKASIELLCFCEKHKNRQTHKQTSKPDENVHPMFRSFSSDSCIPGFLYLKIRFTGLPTKDLPTMKTRQLWNIKSTFKQYLTLKRLGGLNQCIAWGVFVAPP